MRLSDERLEKLFDACRNYFASDRVSMDAKELAALIAEVRALRECEKLAEFGAWALGELRDDVGSDLDGGSAQEKAVELGLLSRRTDTTGDAQECGDGCEWSPGDDLSECWCLFDATDFSAALAGVRALEDKP